MMHAFKCPYVKFFYSWNEILQNINFCFINKIIQYTQCLPLCTVTFPFFLFSFFVAVLCALL